MTGSGGAVSAGHCGEPLVTPWTERLERAWRDGFRRARLAALAIPVVLLVGTIARNLPRAPTILPGLLTLMVTLAFWRFVAGVAAVAVAEWLRKRLVTGEAKADVWAWSHRAVMGVIGAYAMVFVVMSWPR